MKAIVRISMAVLGLVALACTKGTPDYNVSKEDAYDMGGISAPDGAYGGDTGGGQGGNFDGEPGVITAAEWNDLLNWEFWGGLMTGNFSSYNGYWGFNTSKRIAVKTVDANGNRAKCLPVKLMKGEEICWEAVTDNSGEANLWIAATDVQSTVSVADCRVVINGVEQQNAPAIWAWDSQQGPVVNQYTVEPAQSLSNNVDIAFIVDATGSMADEIAFLKSDLRLILDKVSLMETERTIFTGTVFYRDADGDEYLTKFSPFTTDISSTVAFIGQQYADGGGDIPEAVHTALEVGLTQLQWHSSAYSKMAFIILDAPAHKDHPGVIESLQNSVRQYAAKGIKIIPVFCSSSEKDCEFMCRQFAILTGGTYVFLTDDSGVGGEHIEASVGEYQVESLQGLIVRLITKYIQ